MSRAPFSYGANFAARSVVQNYKFRPPYSPEVFDTLVSLIAPGDTRVVLDAGCGTGKIAIGLADRVEHVDAVDPAEEMLSEGRLLAARFSDKISWVCSKIEDAPLRGPYGLIVAAASFGWMDANTTLARFADWLTPDGMLALVVGDAPIDSPWEDEEKILFSDFIERLQGVRPDFSRTARQRLDAPLLVHPQFRAVGHRITQPFAIAQTIDEYLACQHSRATWSLENMGHEMAEEFDLKLTKMLDRYVKDGLLHYGVQTRIDWGRPLPRG